MQPRGFLKSKLFFEKLFFSAPKVFSFKTYSSVISKEADKRMESKR